METVSNYVDAPTQRLYLPYNLPVSHDITFEGENFGADPIRCWLQTNESREAVEVSTDIADNADGDSVVSIVFPGVEEIGLSGTFSLTREHDDGFIEFVQRGEYLRDRDLVTGEIIVENIGGDVPTMDSALSLQTVASSGLFKPMAAPMIADVGYVETGDNIRDKVSELIKAGKKEIIIQPGTYTVDKPIILTGDEVILRGGAGVVLEKVHDGLADAQDFGKVPFIHLLANEMQVVGITFDFKRPGDFWRNYARGIEFGMPGWHRSFNEYDGPTSVPVKSMLLEDCTFIDSNNRQKADVPQRPQDTGNSRRDNWGIVSNNVEHVERYTVRNNHITMKDSELTGGTWGADYMLFEGNECFGGFTTGGQVGALSRYPGAGRTVKEVIFRGNSISDAYRYCFSVGADSTVRPILDFEKIVIENNRVVLSPDYVHPAGGTVQQYSRLATIKLFNFEGEVIVRGNLLDGSNLDPTAAITPRDVVAWNYTRELDGEIDYGKGSFIYAPSELIKPAGATWNFIDTIRASSFASVTYLYDFGDDFEDNPLEP